MQELSQDTIERVLLRNGVGVLALVDNHHPYAIPMSFGYDGSSMLFPMQWGTGYDGRKERCVEANANACFTIYERDTDDDSIWRSVVITGQLAEIEADDKEQAYASLAANAEFAPELGVWGIPFDDVNLRLLKLDPDTVSGREFSPYSSG
ncbi:MAG: pyridoxamine 5'-phosphate oxidase family protein [Halodesulfurarchaeum sp.]